tara:strand:+ start:667 stop:1158 length:492 start_codon:yes stop_codon:yes gene_type:complete
MKIYGVIGWKNSGKTTLIERLIADIVSRGFSVSTIKHAHHTFDVDQSGKDSYRHRVAGASEVLLTSSKRFALMHEIRDFKEPLLAALLIKLAPVDVVLVEGYKSDNHPKIEAHRRETGKPLIATKDKTVRAIATNAKLDFDLPVFGLDDTQEITEFILAELGL